MEIMPVELQNVYQPESQGISPGDQQAWNETAEAAGLNTGKGGGCGASDAGETDNQQPFTKAEAQTIADLIATAVSGGEGAEAAKQTLLEDYGIDIDQAATSDLIARMLGLDPADTEAVNAALQEAGLSMEELTSAPIAQNAEAFGTLAENNQVEAAPDEEAAGQALTAEQAQQAIDAIKVLSDPNATPEEKQQAIATLTELGFSQEDISTIASGMLTPQIIARLAGDPNYEQATEESVAELVDLPAETWDQVWSTGLANMEDQSFLDQVVAANTGETTSQS